MRAMEAIALHRIRQGRVKKKYGTFGPKQKRQALEGLPFLLLLLL